MGVMAEREPTRRKERQEIMSNVKWQQFKDYYLGWVIAVLAAAAVVLYMLVRFLQPPKEPALTVAVFDTEIDENTTEQWTGQIAGKLGLPEGEEVLIRSGYASADANDLTGISVLTSSGDVDVIIAGRDAFAEMAKYGYFKDLSQFLPAEDYTEMENRGVIESFTYSSQAVSEQAQGEGELASGMYPFGVSLADSVWWSMLTELGVRDAGMNRSEKEMVMGVVLESEKEELLIQLIKIISEAEQ